MSRMAATAVRLPACASSALAHSSRLSSGNSLARHATFCHSSMSACSEHSKQCHSCSFCNCPTDAHAVQCLPATERLWCCLCLMFFVHTVAACM